MAVKFTLFIFAVSLPILMIAGCETDAECGKGKCCRHIVGGVSLFRQCYDYSQPDDRCEGQTRCQCISGYKCQKDEPSFLNRFKFGVGTCQFDVDVQNENQRRVFIDV